MLLLVKGSMSLQVGLAQQNGSFETLRSGT
jgi:hypothetical protein